MKGNIGLLFKQTGSTVIAGGTTYETLFACFFSTLDAPGKDPQGKPWKYYNPQTGVWVYSSTVINGTNAAISGSGLSGEYQLYIWFSNPLSIKTFKTIISRNFWFDSNNWEVVKKFKNLENWDFGGTGTARFTFDDINFNIFPKLKNISVRNSGTPSTALIRLSENYQLENIIIDNLRDYILPNFQLNDNIKSFNSARTLVFTINPTPYLNFSNKLLFNSLILTGSTQYSGVNISGCTGLVTLQLRNIPAVSPSWLTGLNTCINLQNIQIGGTGVNYGTIDLTIFPNLVTIDLASAGLTNAVLPVVMPSSCSFISLSNNNVTNNWINNLRTSRPVGLTLNVNFSKANRGSIVVDIPTIIPHTLTDSIVNLSNSNYTVSEVNKILFDLDQKWINGGQVDLRNQNAPDNFSGGYNGEASFLSLQSKGANMPVGGSYNNYPSYREYKVTTTVANQVVTIDKGIPAANNENSIDWGDGSKETYTNSTPSTTKNHTYVTAGTYTIRSWYNADTISDSAITEVAICMNSGSVTGLSGLPNFTTLKYVKNVGQTANTTRNLSATSYINNPNFTTFLLPDTNTNVTMIAHANASLSTLDLSGNALTAASIEVLLVNMNANSAFDAIPRFIKLEGGTNAAKSTWSSAANSAYTSLASKNFTITYNA